MQGYFRAILCFIGILVVIPAIFYIIGLVFPQFGVSAYVFWKYIVYPHDWFVIRENGGSKQFFSDPYVYLMPLLQWIIVGLSASYLLRNKNLKNQLVFSHTIIVLTGMSFLFISNLLGLTFEPDLL